MPEYFLGIDTSNYTTSVAFCDGEGNIALNAKKMLKVPEGGRGLRQSDAVFLHVQNTGFVSSAIADFIGKDRDARIAGSLIPLIRETPKAPICLAFSSARDLRRLFRPR